MRRTISELFIYFHLKRMNIKFFQISNIGNVQYGDIPVNKNILKGYLAIYWKNLIINYLFFKQIWNNT